VVAFPEVAVRFLRRPWLAAGTLLILLIGLAFLTQVVPYRQILEARHDVSGARDHLAQLEVENRRLESDVEALGTEAEIEKLAREKLGYVRPGEVAYVVLDPPDAPATESAPEEDDLEEESRTWVERIWDFLTGADLRDDDAG
jgi:cell division protein FtsB